MISKYEMRVVRKNDNKMGLTVEEGLMALS